MQRNEFTYILGIESSCDETSAAVIQNGKILSNYTAGQTVHASFGGVVPEMASREHQRNIVPVVDTALKMAGIEVDQLHAIAVTTGPGLMGSLHVGVSFAKSLAQSLGIPIIDVHHMQAHVLALLIDDERQTLPTLPFVCLTVSGGHTQFIEVNKDLSLTLLGETLDDAAGEAFDKAAKLLGLPYPGGPEIDRRAQLGNPEAFAFNKPRTEGLTVSFSGLKTSILYFLQEKIKENPRFIEENLNDLAASIQQAIVSILVEKATLALKTTGMKTLALAGGVSANSGLRAAVAEKGKKQGWSVHLPAFEYTTDNAAMIAQVGWLKFQAGQWGDLRMAAQARMPLATKL